MNVCLLSKCFDVRTFGLGRVSQEVRNELRRRGYQIKTVEARNFSLYGYLFYTLFAIRFRIPKRFDVYHALTPLEALYIPKDRGVVTFHDIALITDPGKMGAGLGYSRWMNFGGRNYFRFSASIAKKCRKVVACTDGVKQDLVEHLGIPEEKVRVIYLGVPRELEPRQRKRDVFRVGYLGALDKRKRINLLITAFKKSKLDELVIGGIGTDERILMDQAKNDSRIKFLGLINHGLVDFYNSLDVFVFPTWLDNSVLPVIEAMACKKPVIVLDDAIIPAELKKRCIVLEHREFASAFNSNGRLENLCNSIDIEDNYRWAKAHSWSKCVDEYIEVYKELA